MVGKRWKTTNFNFVLNFDFLKEKSFAGLADSNQTDNFQKIQQVMSLHKATFRLKDGIFTDS